MMILDKDGKPLAEAIPIEDTLKSAQVAQIEAGAQYLLIATVQHHKFDREQQRAFADTVGRMFREQFRARVVVLFNDAKARTQLYRVEPDAIEVAAERVPANTD